ncbi:MAG: BrnT family toxin [Thermomicrobiales bacterium]
MDLEFDWDPIKRRINLDKHGLDFVRAVEVFDDPQHLDEDSTRPEHGEIRRKVIGRSGQMMVCVIYADRGRFRRIISARRARRDERERYRQSAETA